VTNLSLHEKLLNAQKDLKAPKGQFNKFGKYNYRSAEDILEAVKPVNAGNELTLTLSDEPVMIGDRIYIKATATLVYKEEALETTAYAREALTKKGMDESQITGTASSYARKYALNGLYLIDDTKDADTDEYVNQNKSKPTSSNQMAKKPDSQHNETKEKQLAELQVALKEYAEASGNDDAEGINKLQAWALGQLGVDTFNSVPESKINGFIKSVNVKITNKQQQNKKQESLFEGRTTTPKA